MDAYFTSAKLTNSNVFASHVESISNCPVINACMKVTAGLLVVLNEDRQIVRLNDAFIAEFGVSSPAKVLGLRLCEALNCVHAAELPYECEITPHCVTCGAAVAMMSAISNDQVSEKICALTAKKDGATFDRYLSVRAQPLKIDNKRWILIFVQDITHQHSLSTLEHIFYHDINNILTALIGNCEMLVREMPEQHRARLILNAANRLSAEVSLQRILSNKKDWANLIKKRPVFVNEINEEVELIMHGHPKFYSRKLEQTWPEENIKIHTDIHLISRILGNMLLNALEATVEGGVVRLNTTVNDTDIIWEVWNEGYIPPEVQPWIFQKHFSTKASMGRGLGTYSMKLFGEEYLNGEVTLNSSMETGTTFCLKHPLNPT